MGEIAESLLDGECCEGCGEYIGEGTGYTRRCPACSGPRTEPTYGADTTKIKTLLLQNGYTVMLEKDIQYGTQLRLAGGEILNVFSSGKVILQGKPNQQLKDLIKGGKHA